MINNFGSNNQQADFNLFAKSNGMNMSVVYDFQSKMNNGPTDSYINPHISKNAN